MLNNLSKDKKILPFGVLYEGRVFITYLNNNQFILWMTNKR